jgi:uncharacterized protein YaaQ
VESIVQDPDAQSLIREWQAKQFAQGLAEVFTMGFAESFTKGFVEGVAKGRADEARLLLYKVLAVRSFLVTPDVRARIEGEPDAARLEAWLEAAVTAGAVGDVLRDG